MWRPSSSDACSRKFHKQREAHIVFRTRNTLETTGVGFVMRSGDPGIPRSAHHRRHRHSRNDHLADRATALRSGPAGAYPRIIAIGSSSTRSADSCWPHVSVSVPRRWCWGTATWMVPGKGWMRGGAWVHCGLAIASWPIASAMRKLCMARATLRSIWSHSWSALRAVCGRQMRPLTQAYPPHHTSPHPADHQPPPLPSLPPFRLP